MVNRAAPARSGEQRHPLLEAPLNSVTASSVPSALASAFFEQANGGFYDGSGRAAEAPMSTITSSGSNQQLVTAYLVKYYSSGGQWQKADEPMHTLPTKGRMGLVQSVQVPADCLSPEHRAKARRCAELLHEHLPEHFPEPADLVLMSYDGIWWVLVDITLRMLKARELYRAQAFPDSYIIHEIPDPLLLFKEGVQVADPWLSPRPADRHRTGSHVRKQRVAGAGRGPCAGQLPPRSGLHGASRVIGNHGPLVPSTFAIMGISRQLHEL